MAISNHASPQFTARMTGALWLAVIVISSFAIAGPTIIVPDAATTANNILASELAFRFGVVNEFIGGACYVGVTVLLYQLLKPVSKSLALFAAACGIIGITVGAGLTVRDLGIVAILKSAQTAPAADAAQLQAVARSAIMAFGLGFKVSMVYFGLQCATAGYLIARSGFIPRIVGILLGVGGSFYVISSLTYLLSPALGSMLSPVVIPVAFLGEGCTTLWLLFKGVDVERWRQRAGSTTLNLAAA
jgi:hypothetical protein